MNDAIWIGEVTKLTRHLEACLRHRHGADGEGLMQLAKSVQHRLPAQAIPCLRRIAQERNTLAHEDGYAGQGPVRLQPYAERALQIVGSQRSLEEFWQFSLQSEAQRSTGRLAGDNFVAVGALGPIAMTFLVLLGLVGVYIGEVSGVKAFFALAAVLVAVVAFFRLIRWAVRVCVTAGRRLANGVIPYVLMTGLAALMAMAYVHWQGESQRGGMPVELNWQSIKTAVAEIPTGL